MKKRFIHWLLRQLQVPDVVLTDLSDQVAITTPALSGVQPLGLPYEPDKEFEEIATRSVPSPVWQFHEALEKGKARVREAWLFEGRFDQRGRLIESKRPEEPAYRVRFVEGHGKVMEALRSSSKQFRVLPEKIQKAIESKERFNRGMRRLKEMGMVEDSFDTDASTTGQYDPGQYTEFTPTYGGPFNKQLYLADYLTMHARAFEARNHNPIAKRIIDVLTQYAFGRRFKVRVHDEKKKKAWRDFEKRWNIVHKMAKYWCPEFLTYGEFMLNKTNYTSMDPSTVWDVITDPDDITNVYYYYQSYPTAFQTFTGYQVPGAPGSKDTKPIEFIIRQTPAKQVIHVKSNVVSQEKRGRSILFPVLGWCKRIKDLYNFQVMRAQLQATFVWDDTITGSEADISSHLARYSKMQVQPAVFAHNDKIKRQAMAAVSESGRSGVGVGEEIMALIATAVGIPKDFFNIMGGSGMGSNRATAMVGAEPFEKVVQNIQAEFEKLGLELAEIAIKDAGLDYEPGDVEFIFPSVTKDTTSESLKNISLCESLDYFDHQMAAEMSAVEMDVTGYDYEATQDRITKRQETMPPTPGMPGVFGNPAPGSPSPFVGGQNGSDKSPAGSPIHGDGKNAIKRQLKR